MSNSRRGLLAAGLAAAVVGSMGVVWTLNASAEETPEVEAPAAATPVAAEDEPAPVPPALLPWGERPHKLKRGKAGASSAAITAAGADAAPAEASGSLASRPGFTPKGRSFKRTRLPAPPAPPVPSAVAPITAKEPDSKPGPPYYSYAGGYQRGENEGSHSYLNVAKPELAAKDEHTLAEISVQSGGATDAPQNTIEVGWIVDPKMHGDRDPHLFVFFWVNGVEGCYNNDPRCNGAGFVPYKAPGEEEPSIRPGDTLPTDKPRRFGIQHSGGNWWLAYDSVWFGYYPDSLWGGKYTKSNLVQWFGEVLAADEPTCSDMGTGVPSGEKGAARFIGLAFVNGPTVQPGFWTPDQPLYSAQPAGEDPRIFRFGGRGSTACPV